MGAVPDIAHASCGREVIGMPMRRRRIQSLVQGLLEQHKVDAAPVDVRLLAEASGLSVRDWADAREQRRKKQIKRRDMENPPGGRII